MARADDQLIEQFLENMAWAGKVPYPQQLPVQRGVVEWFIGGPLHLDDIPPSAIKYAAPGRYEAVYYASTEPNTVNTYRYNYVWTAAGNRLYCIDPGGEIIRVTAVVDDIDKCTLDPKMVSAIMHEYRNRLLKVLIDEGGELLHYETVKDPSFFGDQIVAFAYRGV